MSFARLISPQSLISLFYKVSRHEQSEESFCDSEFNCQYSPCFQSKSSEAGLYVCISIRLLVFCSSSRISHQAQLQSILGLLLTETLSLYSVLSWTSSRGFWITWADIHSDNPIPDTEISVSHFLLTEKQYLIPTREAYIGSNFQKIVEWFQGRNGMGEGHRQRGSCPCDGVQEAERERKSQGEKYIPFHVMLTVSCISYLTKKISYNALHGPILFQMCQLWMYEDYRRHY